MKVMNFYEGADSYLDVIIFGDEITSINRKELELFFRCMLQVTASVKCCCERN